MKLHQLSLTMTKLRWVKKTFCAPSITWTTTRHISHQSNISKVKQTLYCPWSVLLARCLCCKQCHGHSDLKFDCNRVNACAVGKLPLLAWSTKLICCSELCADPSVSQKHTNSVKTSWDTVCWWYIHIHNIYITRTYIQYIDISIYDYSTIMYERYWNRVQHAMAFQGSGKDAGQKAIHHGTCHLIVSSAHMRSHGSYRSAKDFVYLRLTCQQIITGTGGHRLLPVWRPLLSGSGLILSSSRCPLVRRWPAGPRYLPGQLR